jgi:transposase
MDERGQIVLRKRLARHALMPFIVALPPVLIGMEACGGAHDWARRFREPHHEVKLTHGAPVCQTLYQVKQKRHA